ncbi:MAG: hypothetical protein V1887_02765 [Candidatus Aenigmatarchaeota archaeon]
MDIPEYVRRFVDEQELEVVERFGSGNSGALVYRVRTGGKDAVLKMASGGRGLDEIRGNIAGYEKIREARLEEILPEDIRVYADKDFTAILMEYLGDSFYDRTLKEPEPTGLYRELAGSFRRLCERTVRKDDESRRMLVEVKDNLRAKYEDFLLGEGYIGKQDVGLLDSVDTDALSPDFSSFGCYDFTPEDVFLVNGRLKYPDPKQDVRGCPLISLAAFAGVSRDSYGLPGSEEGYGVLERLAVEDLPELLHISQPNARRLFSLGRAMQLAISSKYRIGTDPGKAKLFAAGSVDCLAHVLESRPSTMGARPVGGEKNGI